MKKLFHANLGIGLLVGVFFVFTMFNNTVLSGIRLDLTENKLFTLSEGSREIVSQIDEPINLYFFFSDAASRDLTSLRAYAKQVQALLEEYALASKGKIQLHVIDPAPFSEEEDQAAEFGLQAVPVNNAGENIYFGLAGTNALDDQGVISFFQPDKERFLEYDVSKLIQNLLAPEKATIGLMSSLKIQGDIDMQTFQTSPALMIVDQLGELFEIKNIEMTASEIPEDVDLLMLVHPKSLSEETEFAIDQFAMSGGRILAFVDPLAEMDRPAQNPMMQASPPAASDLTRLLASWGVSLEEGVVLGDAQTALAVSGSDGLPVRHLAILGMGEDNFSGDDIAISGLENINLASAGILKLENMKGLTATTLIHSTEYSEPIPVSRLQFLSDPKTLQQEFKATGEQYPVAVRLTGSAKSAFPDAEQEGAIENTDDLNVVVIADTDLLADHMWVQIQEFFGQRIASPWAANGDFIINLADNLVGSPALISIRSRGQYGRPFDVVQNLRREAEARYLESAEELQRQLLETENELAALQTNQDEQGLLRLSSEQQSALDRFQEDKLRIRKQLRDVRHQLDKDIEGLGSRLKFLNIAFIPIFLTLMLVTLNKLRLRRAGDVSGGAL